MTRRLLTLAALITAISTVRELPRRWAVMRLVAPELRNWQLYLPMPLNTLTYRLARSLSGQSWVRPGVRVETHVIPHSAEPDIRVILYEPERRARPSGALLYIHGGGMVSGTPEQRHDRCSFFADELGILVVNVDYRLAPENPFPNGLDDCYAALYWLHENAASLGVDAERIGVGGDSAGGGLAAALCQLARDRRIPGVACQLLLYPMLDDRTVLRTDHHGRGQLAWTPASNRYAWTAYLGHPPSMKEERPYAAAARCTNLAGPPPAWIGVGELDLFYDEDLEYARRLEAAGVPCRLYLMPGMYHSGNELYPDTPITRALNASMVSFLRSVFAG